MGGLVRWGERRLRPRIETERLVLREFVPEDAALVLALNTDSEVTRFMPKHAYENEDLKRATKRVEISMAYYEKHSGLGIWPTVLKGSGETIGWTCLKHLGETDEIELGYRFLPQFWGRGLCTEISTALVRYGFEDLGLQRIVGITDPRNLASRRVLEKLGFRYVKDAHYYGHDVHYFVLTSEAGPGS